MILGAIIALTIWCMAVSVFMRRLERKHGVELTLTPRSALYAMAWTGIGALVGHFVG